MTTAIYRKYKTPNLMSKEVTTTEQRAKELADAVQEMFDEKKSNPKNKGNGLLHAFNKVAFKLADFKALAGATETNMPNSSGCTCDPLERHGETGIMCCNHCGKPVEEFWVNGMNDGQQWIKEHSTPAAPSGVTFYATASPDAGDWKSVEDGLPEIGETVLVSDGTRVKEVLYCKRTTNDKPDFLFTTMKNITHWRPLPSPPKNDNQIK